MTRTSCPGSTVQKFFPDFMVRPRTVQEVTEVVKLANKLGVPVVPCGGGRYP